MTWEREYMTWLLAGRRKRAYDTRGPSSIQAEILVHTFDHFYSGMSNGKFYSPDSAGKKCVSFQRCLAADEHPSVS